MLLFLSLSVMTQFSPGPVDAFRANLSSIKVSADFDFKIWYNFNSASLGDLRAFRPNVGPVDEPGYIVQGRWEHDGSTERYVQRVTGGRLFNPNSNSGPMPSVEALLDDEMFAFHYLKPGERSFRVHALPDRFPIPLVGPLTWYSLSSFDRDLKVNFARALPVRSRGERGGHPTEIEVYQKDMGEIKVRVEVAYDSGVGYLPRFCRGLGIGVIEGRSIADIDEFYLVDAKPCRAGGFVPTEWYQLRYQIENFTSKFPNYDENTSLNAFKKTTVLHFKANKLEDKKDKARLEDLTGINVILAPGGPVFSKTKFSPMTLAQAKIAMGAKARNSNMPSLPAIDEVELHEFNRPKKTYWPIYVFAGLALIAVVSIVIRRRLRVWIALIGLVSLGGCSQRPVPRLTAAFTNSCILYDPTQPSLRLDLMINNVGNQRLRITNADAGCSCRQVDPTQLPASLSPGEQMKLAVTLSGGTDYKTNNFNFTFLTDHGALTATVALLSIPKHHLSPQSITMNGLDESSSDEVAGFDLIHREVFEQGKDEPTIDLVVPTGFVKEKLGIHNGRVPGSSNLGFKDTKYHLTLKDQSLGLHRADVTLNDKAGRRLIEAPVIWQRLPFLSSIPDQIELTKRPSRIFLRCPDESVEFTQVRSVPLGVKAELDSPRSIRVTLLEDAPFVLKAFIEVETSSANPRSLRIPVVRYTYSNNDDKP